MLLFSCYLRMMIFSQWKDTMDDNNQTSGQPKPEPEECVKEQKITDHFKIMIDKARKAQKLILIKRADDLLRWGAQEEYDFSKIFGVMVLSMRRKYAITMMLVRIN